MVLYISFCLDQFLDIEKENKIWKVNFFFKKNLVFLFRYKKYNIFYYFRNFYLDKSKEFYRISQKKNDICENVCYRIYRADKNKNEFFKVKIFLKKFFQNL